MGTLHWGGVGGGLAKPGSYIGCILSTPNLGVYNILIEYWKVDDAIPMFCFVISPSKS